MTGQGRPVYLFHVPLRQVAMTTRTEDLSILDGLEPKFQRFTYDKRVYVIREPSADAVCQWRNSLMEGTTIDKDGKPSGFKPMAHTDLILVRLSLYKASVNAQGEIDRETLVDESEVKSLPNRLQQRLLKWVREAGELDEVQEDDPLAIEKQICELQSKLNKLRGISDAEKNGQSATAATSA